MKRFISIAVVLVMLFSMTAPAMATAPEDGSVILTTDPMAIFGTPQLGSNDPLWGQTMEHIIDKSTVPDDPRPKATGTARILWDQDYLYARVVVTDSDVFTGYGPDHMYDSLEFYVGTGSRGANQWRVSATGVLSGQTAPGRAAWTQLTETGYIVEVRIPKRTLTLQAGLFSFEVYINNSTSLGNNRYEVVSCFGNPDTAYSSDSSYRDKLTLVAANEPDNRFSITATAGSGGTISPSAPGDVLRVAAEAEKTFTFIPAYGKVLDTVTIDDVIVSVTNNTYTFENVSANQKILATFKNDPDAELLHFIVWNDNFAKGEYTTAVIIDLGEGKAVNGSELYPDMFAVSARNTSLNGAAVTFEGTRNITRVYANDEPSVRGYQGPVANSPDYQDGLESGRYIVVEFDFYTASGGVTTLDGSSNSTLQVYSVVQKKDITLTEGRTLDYVVFEQEKVVNPILDKFTTPTGNSVNRALYLHKNEMNEIEQGLPLYVYIHGMSRGGTSSATDQKAAMKSANGSVALMKKMEENPDKYASHVLNISYNGTSTPSTANVKAVIDNLVATGAVDPNRIYVAGFSWGGQYTNSLLNAFPGFFAAGAPMSPVSGSPNAAGNEAHADLAYWMFVNSYDGASYQTNLQNFANNNLPKMTNARATLLGSNKSFAWPYHQFEQPEQNPPLQTFIAHEVEAAVLYNKIHETDWSIAPTAGTVDRRYKDVFDWMFAQSKTGETLPTDPMAIFGTPQIGTNDPLWEQTMEHRIDRSTVPDDTRPKATGTARILWDEDYLYARVVVTDSDVYQGMGSNHEYDSLEFYVGPGNNGANQWRVSATGVLSGQTAQGRAAWTQMTDTGYIVEMRIPKRTLTLQEGPLTLEIYINNSSSNGNDRYEVVSCFGTPDTGFSGHASFADSLMLIAAKKPDNRFSIAATTGPGGEISPSAPGDVLRVEAGEVTFTFTPDLGKIIDTVTVDDTEVSLTENTYTLEIVADHKIHATFKNDPDAEVLPFIVWNDNFAKGEYTTAVIIDLGEGKEANGSELSPDMFAVSARNTSLDGTAVTFEGTRNITRVYANDEPSVRGYQGPVANSTDYRDGLESGRYIVVEFEFYTSIGGLTTLDGSSNSTLQNYSVIQASEITLIEGNPLTYVVFEQEKVVNPILDKFTTGNFNTFNYARYLHTDVNGEVVEGLPLYIYTHGNTRGGTNAAIDQKAAMKSANGAVALMKKMDENPDKYASHVLNVSSSSGTPNTAHVKEIIDEMIANGSVDPNRIYLSGFSMGAGYTNNLLRAYPGFFSAAAPMAFGNGPNAASDPAHKDLAYWVFANAYDYPFIVSGVNTFAANQLPHMTNARVSVFDSNENYVWPYNQFDQPDLRPPMANYVGHEIEAAVLYNRIYEADWNIAPTAGTVDPKYTDVFDWMFAQSKSDGSGNGEIENAIVLKGASAVDTDETFAVQVDMENVKGDVFAQDIHITYDANLFTLLGVEAADGIQIISPDDETELVPGTVRVIAFNVEGLTGDAPLFRLTFKATDEGGQTGDITVALAKLGVAPAGTVLDGIGNTLAVTVRGIPVEGVSLNKSTLRLTILGASEALSATIAPANATNRNVTWSSSNPAVATVDSNGVVTAVGDGVAVIAVTTEEGGLTATCSVIVLVGDLNGTGVIDIGDLAMAAYFYGASASSDNWEQAKVADLNQDGKVDILDLAMLAKKILN